MSFENLNTLIEQHRKETQPYENYEFDSTSYTLLLADINNLLKENQELKKKYENTVADYETTMFEKEQLKKQLEEYKLQNINLREDIMIQKIAFPNKLIKDKTFYNLYDMPTYEEVLTQQKEFIKWLKKKQSFLRDEISELTLGMCNTDFQDIKIEVYGKVLQKYKEIIGDDK